MNRLESYDLAQIKEVSQLRVIVSQVAPVMVKNLLLIAYGTTIGYPTILIPSLSSCSSSEELCLSELQISWIGSILLLSSALGSLISGVVSQVVGRRITMQVCSILIIISWIIFKYCDDIWQIYFSLAVSGLSGGLLESPVLTYVAEIAEPQIRGSILPLGSLSSNLGIVSIFALGSVCHWRTVTQYVAIIPTSSFILLFFVPESPPWLIAKNRLEDARKSLARLRGWTVVERVEAEFQELLFHSNELNSLKENRFKIVEYRKPEFVQPYLLIFCLFVCYNFSGSQTIPVHAVKIFQVMNVPIDEYNATVFLGLSQLLGCLTCALIVRYTGKRIITFFSITVAIFSVVIIGAYAYLTKIKYLYAPNEVNESSWLIEYNWIPLVCIFFAAFAIDGGIRTVVWSLVSECFPMNTRAVATGSMGALSYLLGFTANKTFLELVNAITFSGVLWFYGVVGVISLVIIYIWMPETEAKSLQQITDHFAGKSKLGRSVK